MTLRLRSHGQFQCAVLILTALGGAAGLLTWVLSVQPSETVLAASTATAAALLAARDTGAAPGGGRWRLWPEVMAVAGVVPAWLATPVLFGEAPASPLAATLGGWTFGLVAGLGQLGAQLQMLPADEVQRAMEKVRDDLAGRELTLASRAAAAHRQIHGGVAGLDAAEARRLHELSRRLALQVLALAGRSHALHRELGQVDDATVRERVAALAQHEATARDEFARRDLARARRELTTMGERLALSRMARERILARLELQTTLLESTALALAAQRASVAAGDAADLAPISGSLDDAAGRLQAEAAASGELEG